MRRKSIATLREDGVTTTGFLRELCSMFLEPKPKQLQDFQSRCGPLAGNTSRDYFAADVSEKLRLRQGKKKSKARVETEKM